MKYFQISESLALVILILLGVNPVYNTDLVNHQNFS
jgi:hypothetical protein